MDAFPSIFGTLEWSESDALAVREFFRTTTGKRLANVLRLNAPIPTVANTVSAEKLVGRIDGYFLALSILDNSQIVPGTINSDGTPDPRATLPDLDAPVGSEDWGGRLDPAEGLLNRDGTPVG